MASSYSCTKNVVGILRDLWCQAGNFLYVQLHSVSYVDSSYSCTELWLTPWEVQGAEQVCSSASTHAHELRVTPALVGTLGGPGFGVSP